MMKNSTYQVVPEAEINELRVINKVLIPIAILTGLLYLRAIIASTFTIEIVADNQVVSALAVLCLIGAIIGLSAAWRWERAGGLSSLVCGLFVAAFSFMMTAENHWLVSLFYSSPFIIVGALCLLSWRTSKTRQ